MNSYSISKFENLLYFFKGELVDSRKHIPIRVFQNSGQSGYGQIACYSLMLHGKLCLMPLCCGCFVMLACASSQRYFLNELFDHLSLLSTFFISDGHLCLKYVDLALQLVYYLSVLSLPVQVLPCDKTVCNAS